MISLILGSACGTKAAAPSSARPGNSATPAERRIIGEGVVEVPYADSLWDVAANYNTIAVGRVTAILLPFDPRPGYLGATPPAPPDVATVDPGALNRPPGNGSTVYSIDVLRVIGASSSVKVGDSIAVLQGGGVFRGVPYEYSGDALIQLGVTYVFFLVEREPTVAHPWGVTFSAPSFGHFPLDAAGRLQAPDASLAKRGAVAALAGLTVDEAAAKIEQTLRSPRPTCPPSRVTVVPPGPIAQAPAITATPPDSGTPTATPTLGEQRPVTIQTETATPTMIMEPQPDTALQSPTATSTPAAVDTPVPGCPP